VISLSDTPRLQYYDVQTLGYRYISKLILSPSEYLCHKWPRICSTCRKHFTRSFTLSLLTTWCVNKLTWRLPLGEQELLPLPESLISIQRQCLVFFSCFISVLIIKIQIHHCYQKTHSSFIICFPSLWNLLLCSDRYLLISFNTC
jgi:hypothetical protein